MDLKRYFRGPFLAILVTVIVVIAVFEYASSGGGYQTKPTSQVLSLIAHNQIKSAQLIDKSDTIQVITRSGAKLQADFVANASGTLQPSSSTCTQAASFPAATSNGWRWRPHCFTNRKSCSSTSRLRVPTRGPGGISGGGSPPWPIRV
jgi:hypothetical protein